MSNRIYHIEEDGGLHHGALDHDVQMILENKIINHFSRYEIDQDEAIASIRRVLDDIEGGR